MRRTSGLLLAVALSAPGLTHAQAPVDDMDVVEEFVPPERLAVIQKRKFELSQEVAFSAGILPVDPYYKGLTGSVGYTIHFSEDWAWEVAQLTYSFNLDTSLKRKLYQLAAATGGATPVLPEIDWIVASHLVLKPLYGKQALFNTEMVHIEAYLQGGPALVHKTAPLSAPALGLDFGAGLRLWLTKTWSVRFDMGELVYAEEDTSGYHIRQTLHLHLGLAANLSGEE